MPYNETPMKGTKMMNPDNLKQIAIYAKVYSKYIGIHAAAGAAVGAVIGTAALIKKLAENQLNES